MLTGRSKKSQQNSKSVKMLTGKRRKSQQNSKSVKMLTGERKKSQQNGVTSEDADRQAQKKSAEQRNQ